ncbi:PIN domain-containing protein [Hippea alviniae]|uniref:PIN domain-containing protein n=1 Tax=Hippea alviniae TaxID=1279027 RepID=UPI0003B42BE2|nr:PIN domain-containing protein [Hippea alviniae]
MRIVVDSNIVFSALLSKDNRCRRVLFQKKFEFFTCNFLMVEIFENKDKLVKVSKLSENDLILQLSSIFSRIHFFPEDFIPKHFFIKAYEICKIVDDKDTPFVALSLFLNAKLLTGDKKLKESLKGKIDIVSIKELDL